MAIRSAAVFSKHGRGNWSHMQVVDLTERRNLLMAMLDTVYVDIVEEKSVVAIRFKPAFRLIFEVATTRGGNGIVLINETPPDPEGQRLNHCVLGGDGGESNYTENAG